MLKNIVKFLVNGASVYATAYLLSGVSIESFWVALLVSLIISVLNILVKPILSFLSFPVTVLTFGLFTFIIDALIIFIASKIVPGFVVDSFVTAIIFSVVLTIISYVLHKIIA